MQLLKNLTTIDFIGLRKTALVVSILLIVAGVYSLSTKGLNYGIDFTGGTKVELVYESDVDVNELRDSLATNGYEDAVVQLFGSSKDVLIRVPLSEENSSAEVSTKIVELLSDQTSEELEVRAVEFVGPQFGQELFEKGILALVYALIGVMIYVAFRFEWKFSLG